MRQLEFVVLSDLHLGAGYSLLTGSTLDGAAEPERSSHTLTALAVGLRDAVRRVAGSSQPRLVLLGDVFEMSFATPQQSGAAFQRFVEAMWAEPAVFADEIVYVPGNHDHRMWRMIRDTAYLDAVRSHAVGALPPDLVVTDLGDPSMVDAALVTALAQDVKPSLTARAGYPNIGLSAGSDAVVLHHGHYAEATYRAMSKVAEVMTGRPTSTDLRELELLNGPWIDFGWSETGDEAVLGRGLFLTYEQLMDPAATHALVQRVATRLITAAARFAPVAPGTTFEADGFSVTVQGLTEGLLDIVLDRGTSNERNSGRSVLSDDARAGVRDYVAGAVRDQLRRSGWDGDLERPGPDAGRLSFVFGHTHKPFQAEMIVPGFTRPVHVWNTGGWVVDHPGLSPAQGAAAVFVDSDANVASLRLFNDPVNDEMRPVRAEGCHGPDDRRNPLLASLSEAVDRTADGWAAFSARCHDAIEHRARILRSRSFDPSAHPPRAVRGRVAR